MAKTLAFGVGTVYANETPFGIIQNVNLSITGSVKSLFGENIFPEAIGVGTHEVTGSASFAKFNSDLLPRYMFGTQMESGNMQRYEQPASIPAVSPYTITVAQAADFARNVAVLNVATGQHMRLVTTAPAAGQYQVNATTGVYTFNSADAEGSVIIRYDADVATGQHFEMVNRRMGQQTPFTLLLANEFQGSMYALTLYQCVLTKCDMNFTNDDFAVPAVEFSCFTNSANVLGRFDFSETE